VKVILILLVVLIGVAIALLRPKTVASLILAACSSCASAALRNGSPIGGIAMNIRRWGY
jgi:hypothetical protein